MSHYTVGVITKKNTSADISEIEELLAPYDENMELDEYITEDYKDVKKLLFDSAKSEMKNYIDLYTKYKTKVITGTEIPDNLYNSLYIRRLINEKGLENVSSKEKDKIILEHLEKCMESSIKKCEEVKGFVQTDNIEKLSEYNDEVGLFETLDENGNAVSTYNPNSKWDWYTVGGRWHNVIDDNCETLGNIKEKRPVFSDDESVLKNAFQKEYKEYNKLITKGGYFKPEYMQERYPTFKTYLIDTNTFYTHSIVTPEGEWLEAGKMGWFGCDSASTEDQISWIDKFYEIISKYPDDYYMTLVDCHI